MDDNASPRPAITPFRERATAPGNAPPWLRTGSGERWLYNYGLLVDARMSRLLGGINARMPHNSPGIRRHTAQPDALAETGYGFQIGRGLTESDESYGTRLQEALSAWRLAGTRRGVLMQILGYVLSTTPQARMVATRYDRSTSPATRMSSSWDSYPVGRSRKSEPIHKFTNMIGGDVNGEWDWDSASLVSGSESWWGAWVILYATGANNFVDAAIAWGAGSTYAGSGYYSTITGTAYALSGSYTGTSVVWGLGSTYTAAASGYYSTVSGGAYALAGSYTGSSTGWGTNSSGLIGPSIQRIVAQFKSANTWIRGIIVSFDDALFDPDQPVGGGVNPDGEFGQWSTVSGTSYIEARFSSAIYGGEVV